MNFSMFVAPIVLVIGLFGLYDKMRLFRKNGVFPSDSRLYRWFSLLFLLVIPVRDFQTEFEHLKLYYYIFIPIVVAWLVYVHFREGKGYTIVDISDTELILKLEKILNKHRVKFIKETEGKNEFQLSYRLGNSDAHFLLNRSRDYLNETHMYSYHLLIKKWWKLPNSEIVIEDFIRTMQDERKPIKTKKQRLAAVAYGVLLFIGIYLAMNS